MIYATKFAEYNFYFGESLSLAHAEPVCISDTDRSALLFL